MTGKSYIQPIIYRDLLDTFLALFLQIEYCSSYKTKPNYLFIYVGFFLFVLLKRMAYGFFHKVLLFPNSKTLCLLYKFAISIFQLLKRNEKQSMGQQFLWDPVR